MTDAETHAPAAAEPQAGAELKACPFCGEQPISFPSGDGSGLMIECVTNGCANPHVSYYGDGEAARRWNLRPTPATPAPASAPAVGGENHLLWYAQQLATAAAKKAGCVPEWRPLPDVMGCLTQIDNAMTAWSPPPRADAAADDVAALRTGVWKTTTIRPGQPDLVQWRAWASDAGELGMFETEQAAWEAVFPPAHAPDPEGRVQSVLRELYDLVWGECPRLLDEDRGGDVHLDMRISAALASTKRKEG